MVIAMLGGICEKPLNLVAATSKYLKFSMGFLTLLNSSRSFESFNH